METQNCKEFTGLFIVKNCENIATVNCEKCNKGICNTHAFEAKHIFTYTKTDIGFRDNNNTLCISCFVEFDARLTNKIELYSKDRAIWRRKMLERFHKEYPYMVFMAEDYGALFDTTSTYFSHNDTEDGSYFDS
ncbi:hypothetical protein [Tenacibaculum ovolyticum]|uniref:hypothetical protein n=1 Tax=Tenacibaculum ovolyticum TaxID=104270 RepID=UPI00048C3572|nr:hypothetical protein [Tenacibaculum ovolyticum]